MPMSRQRYQELKLVGGADYERLLAERRETRRRSRAKHLEKNRERDRIAKTAAYAADPEHFRQMKRDEYRANPEKYRSEARVRARIKKYGITPEQFDALFSFQRGKCGICRNQLTPSSHVDHCHTTGEVRGLLCNRCNAGLGMFSDNLKRLRSAVKYLERGAERLAVAAQHPLDLKEA